MENINNKRFSDKLSEYFKGNIKLSSVSEECVIIITNNDKCYLFERRDFKSKTKNSLIALSDDIEKVKSLIEESFIDILSFKKVIDFKTNSYKILVRTIDGKVYGCERSELNELREDFIKFETKFQILVNEIVIDMCFGYYAIILTANGIVYEWRSDELVKLEAFKNEKIKAISCSSWHSMALTESGRVYCWENNFYMKLFVVNSEYCNSPKLVELNKKLIWDQISCGLNHSLLLSHDGDIYVYGGNESGELGINDQKFIETPTKLSHSEKFISIASHVDHSFSAALSKNSVYYIWGKCGEQVITQLKETEFKSFNDIFEMYFQITLEPFKGKLIQFYDDLVENYKYANEFVEKISIGGGSYGEVFEVSNKHNKKSAVKRIKFNAMYEKEFMKELETSPVIYQLKHRNIVKYFDVWLEDDCNTNNGIKTYIQNYILYIQMELCDKSLNEVIYEIKSTSNFYSNETLTSLGYYISGQIFIQILEGVMFLHKQNPPIIHRDLNPWNILLKIEEYKNKFVKIADLGLATIHENVNQSHTEDKGHYDYIAPEARNSTKYDTRADIYSLGIVLQKLFFIDDKRDYKIQNGSQSEFFLMNKYLELIDLYDKMTQRLVYKRPVSIERILECKEIWTFNFNEFNYKEEFEKVLNSKESNESFVFKILKKLVFHRNGKYLEKFIEKRKICGGSFGELLEVSEKFGSKGTYVIQKICLRTMNEALIRELRTIYELSNENTIYLDVWFENEIKSCIEYFTLYIQMKSYDKSLVEIIEEIKNDSIFSSNGTLTLFGYYFASAMFTLILRKVYFFHENNPPFIHTNLNPLNIMLKMGSKPDLRIAEFGLVAFHDYTNICLSHTEDRVHQDYRAPEVRSDRSYNTSADIYSLGLVLKDLFLIDVSRDYKNMNELQSESVLMNKYVEISNLCNRMTQTNVIDRPEIKSIFKKRHLWKLDKNEFDFKEEFENLKLINKSIKKTFIHELLENLEVQQLYELILIVICNNDPVNLGYN